MTLNIETIKTIGRIDDEHNEYLEVMCPLLLQRAEEYCHRKFEEVPAGVNIFIAECVKYNLTALSGITSRSMGTVSYSYDLDFPDKLYKYIRTYRRVGFKRV